MVNRASGQPGRRSGRATLGTPLAARHLQGDPGYLAAKARAEMPLRVPFVGA